MGDSYENGNEIVLEASKSERKKNDVNKCEQWSLLRKRQHEKRKINL